MSLTYCANIKSLYLKGCDRIRVDCRVALAGSCCWISRVRRGNSCSMSGTGISSSGVSAEVVLVNVTKSTDAGTGVVTYDLYQ